MQQLCISELTLHNGAQAERWGSELLTEDVEHVDLSSRPFTVRTSDTEVLYAKMCILQRTLQHSSNCVAKIKHSNACGSLASNHNAGN